MVEPYNLGDHPRFAQSSTGSGGGPTSPEMEARVKSLEEKFEKIDTKLSSIQSDVTSMRAKVDHLPSAFNVVQITGILLAASMGGVLAVLKYVATP